MDVAIEAMEREGEEEEISYVGVAKKYGVNESTLRRRHQGKCTTRAEAAQMRQKLNPKKEEELYKYINTLTARVLPPTCKRLDLCWPQWIHFSSQEHYGTL
jgi:transposase-like protein